MIKYSVPHYPVLRTHTHTRTYAHTHTHTRTYARARTHTHTHTQAEDIHEYIDEIIFYIRDQFVDGKASTAKNLIMDSVIVTQNRHCIAMLDKASYGEQLREGGGGRGGRQGGQAVGREERRVVR